MTAKDIKLLVVGCMFAFLAVVCLPVVAEQIGSPGNYGALEDATAGVTTVGAVAASDCSDDSVVFDNNGVQGCGWTSNSAPQALLLKAQACYPGGTQTPANVIIAGGIDELTIAIDDYAQCAGDTVTVTINPKFPFGLSGTSTVLTEGVEWSDDSGTDAGTCSSLASAIDAVSGVSATCSSTTVYITPDITTYDVFLAEGDATCTTAQDNNASRGNILTHGLLGFNVSGGYPVMIVDTGNAIQIGGAVASGNNGNFAKLYAQSSDVAWLAIGGSVKKTFYVSDYVASTSQLSDQADAGYSRIVVATGAPDTSNVKWGSRGHDGTDLNYDLGLGDHVFLNGGVVPPQETSDPCGTMQTGAIFYNSTSNYFCYCNGTDDVKMSDDTTACF